MMHGAASASRRTGKDIPSGHAPASSPEAGNLGLRDARPQDSRLLGAEAASRRFLLNVGSNVVYTALNAVLMAWYIPFLVRHLGVETYGVVPLSNTLVMYAAVVSASLDTSIGRFLAIEMNRGDAAGTRRVFNTALALSLAAGLALSLPASAVALLFPMLFKVPPGLEGASRVLFASVASTMLAAMVTSTFGAVSIVMHRFELRNAVRAAASVSRFGVVVILFCIRPANLYAVAAGFAASALIGIVGDMLAWRRIAPQLRVSWRDVEIARMRQMGHLGGWSMVNQLGFLLLMQTDLVLVNRLYGPEATGRYGSLLLLPGLVYMALETVVTVLGPVITARYAVHDTGGLRRIATVSIRMLGLGLALPVGLLCGFGRPLLTLWLGRDFAAMHLVLVLMVIHLSVNLATRPLAYVLTAYDRLKVQGVITLACGAANVILALVLARGLGWGMAGIAAAGSIVWTIRNAVILTSYTATVMDLRWCAFHSSLVAGGLGTIGIGLIGWWLTAAHPPATWLALATEVAAVAAVYSVAAFAAGLTKSDRLLLVRLASRR